MPRLVLLAAATCLLALALPSLAAPRLRTRGHGRVMNGSAADVADLPWMASLQVLDFHLYGGSIISATWGLTAAQCVDVFLHYDPHLRRVRVGSSNSASGGVHLGVARMIKHAQFHMPTTDEPSVDYDIGAFQPSEPFPLGTDNVQAVSLPPDGYDAPAGLAVTVSGWGDTGVQFEPEWLQRADLRVVDRAACRDTLADVAPVTSRMVCAGHPNMAVGYADAGGPLVHGGVQLGVVSWARLDRLSHLGVYADVGSLRAWIRDNTGV